MVNQNPEQVARDKIDELMDDLVSMDWAGDNQVEIITCKKEITLELTGKPFAEKIG